MRAVALCLAALLATWRVLACLWVPTGRGKARLSLSTKAVNGCLRVWFTADGGKSLNPKPRKFEVRSQGTEDAALPEDDECSSVPLLVCCAGLMSF